MSDNAICSEDGLKYARQLLEAIEQDDSDTASRVLEELSAMRESHLFKELGKLTRDLHDSLINFQMDSKFTAMAEKDIPDAKERLNHVITMTEQAADKTLGAVEVSLGLADELRGKGTSLHQNWKRFRQRDMDVEEFRRMSGELEEFFQWLDRKGPEISSNLSDIMMAQDFQDLTGQIIRRVITLVQDVEEGLVGLIKMTGQKQGVQKQEQAKAEEQVEAVGPAVPGVDKGDIMNNQDDVDDLLSSLGF